MRLQLFFWCAGKFHAHLNTALIHAAYLYSATPAHHFEMCLNNQIMTTSMTRMVTLKDNELVFALVYLTTSSLQEITNNNRYTKSGACSFKSLQARIFTHAPERQHRVPIALRSRTETGIVNSTNLQAYSLNGVTE